jgi:hypothetical protein
VIGKSSHPFAQLYEWSNIRMSGSKKPKDFMTIKPSNNLTGARMKTRIFR